MKEILMMLLPGCPHCRRANKMIEKLVEENPAYREIPIRRVDESVEVDFANSLDYYFVPTFYVEGEKLMEGVPTEEKVRAVLDRALKAE